MKKGFRRKKLAKLSIALAIVVAVCLLLVLKFIGTNSGAVVAKVNNQKIYQVEVEDRLSEMFQGNAKTVDWKTLPKDVLSVLVKDIYVQNELDRKIQKLRVANKRDIKKQIDRYSKRITRQKYVDVIVKEKVNDQTIMDRYVELSDHAKGQKEFNLQHILVGTKYQAKKILSKIKSGESFRYMASRYSVDKNSSKKGGDLGYIKEDNLSEEFFVVVDKLKKNGVSEVFKTKHGWHLVKLKSFKYVKMEDFESIKDRIAEQLKKETIENIFSEISGSVKVEIYD